MCKILIYISYDFVNFKIKFVIHQQVRFSTGKTKDYKINETIDYFELRQAQSDNQITGFRQKIHYTFSHHLFDYKIKA